MKYKTLTSALILSILGIFTLTACDRQAKEAQPAVEASQANSSSTTSAATKATTSSTSKQEDTSKTTNPEAPAKKVLDLEPKKADPIPDFKDRLAALHTASNAQKAQIYTKDFNATLGYLTLYATKSPQLFNNSLPLVRRYSFNNILNAISNNAEAIVKIVNDNKEDQLNLLLPYIYEGLNNTFKKTVAQIKADPEKALVNKYDDFDLEQAYFPVLIAQLDAACKNNNYFNVDLEVIKKETKVTDAQTGEALPFPASEEAHLKDWNKRFARTCYATNILYQLVKNETFSDQTVSNIAKLAATEIEKAREAYKAKQAKAQEEATKKATSPEDKVKLGVPANTPENSNSSEKESTTTSKANTSPAQDDQAQTATDATIPSKGLYIKANQKSASWIGVYNSNGKLITSRTVAKGTDVLLNIDLDTYTIKIGAPYAVEVYIDGVKQQFKAQANPLRILVSPAGNIVR